MKKILILDDDSAIRMLYADELIDEGYDVFTCDEVSRVMDLIADTAPDLLLLDIRLDGYNGFALLQDIKNGYPALPVILCTGYPAYKYDMRSVAADDYVLKSSNLRELKEKIGKILCGGNSLTTGSSTCQEIKSIFRYQETFNWNKEG